MSDPCECARNPNYCTVHNGNKDPICPHCDHRERDAWEIDFGSNDSAEVHCGECDKEYRIVRYVDITYSTRKA